MQRSTGRQAAKPQKPPKPDARATSRTLHADSRRLSSRPAREAQMLLAMLAVRKVMASRQKSQDGNR
jgi:hypothetical protein